MMDTSRAAVTLIVNKLLEEGLIFEGATGEAERGRKPTFLYIDSRQRYTIAVDIRATRTFLLVSDLMGKQLADISSFPTNKDVNQFVVDLAERVKQLVAEYGGAASCEGLGVIVPGIIHKSTGRVLNAPTLGWRDLNLLDPLIEATGLSVHIENSGKACALAQVWATRNDGPHTGDIVFVSVSDGVGVGVVVNGELLRGKHNIAGEFAHVPLNIDGPRCSCGATGCWEAYVSNLATLSRYFGRDLREQKPQSVETANFTVQDLIARARTGDGKAIAALQSTARYLGLGLASIINAIDPGCLYLSGEITTAWDLIEANVRAAFAERALTEMVDKTEIKIVPVEEYPRLRGAAALVAAPAFAAPMVA